MRRFIVSTSFVVRNGVVNAPLDAIRPAPPFSRPPPRFFVAAGGGAVESLGMVGGGNVSAVATFGAADPVRIPDASLDVTPGRVI